MDQGYVTVLAQVWRPSPNDRWFLSKIIYCTVKIATPEELGWYTEDCLALKKEFPDLIAGSCMSPLPPGQRAQSKPSVGRIRPSWSGRYHETSYRLPRPSSPLQGTPKRVGRRYTIHIPRWRDAWRW